MKDEPVFKMPEPEFKKFWDEINGIIELYGKSQKDKGARVEETVNVVYENFAKNQTHYNSFIAGVIAFDIIKRLIEKQKVFEAFDHLMTHLGEGR